MIGLHQHKGASCRVVTPALPPDASANVRAMALEIVGVKSSNQRKGHATALMYQVCADADREGKVLMLMVTEDAERLVKWYQRFGFEPTKDGFEIPVVMIRAAQKPLVVR